MKYANGDVFDGQFVNEQRTGPATCTYGDPKSSIVIFTTKFYRDDIAKSL